MILNEILEHKRKEVARLKRHLPLEKIVKMAEKQTDSKRSLFKALSKRKLHLICELKKASPSEGIIRRQFKPLSLAQEFESAGASAISVLTETRYFKGNPKTLKQIRPYTSIPLLRKDFIVDPYQIYETALLGADSFLMIAMLVSNAELKKMIGLAKQLMLETLVEVHAKEELDRAIQCGAKMIGINNRDLKTLKIDVSVSERLIPLVPKETVIIIESGIRSWQDVVHYQGLGVHNFLVGTILMKSKNVTERIHELSGFRPSNAKS